MGVSAPAGRTLLRGALLGGAGLAAAALIGCGGDDDDDDDDAAADPVATATQAAAATDAAAPDAAEGLVTPAGHVIPLQFPDPPGVTPKAGGVLKQAVAWNVGPIDPDRLGRRWHDRPRSPRPTTV